MSVASRLPRLTCALVCALGASLPVALAAQVDSLPDAWRPAVVRALAARLGVEETRVALAPVRLPAGRPLDLTVEPTLKGTGSGGVWLLEVADTAGARVGVQVRAGVRVTMPVAARDLTRGQILAATDIEWREDVQYGGRQETAAVPGWEVARTIARGETLRPPSVRPAPAVRSGESVQVIWSSERVRLSLEGVALATAGPGEPVRVRLATGRRVQGIAEPGGSVRIEGGAR